MIDFQIFSQLSSMDLGRPGPKPTSFEGNQAEASLSLWISGDGFMRIGVWECTAGRFTAARENGSETCYILSGRASVHGSDGLTRDVSAGELLVLPKGWRGEWTIHETTRKLFVLHSEAF